MFQYAHGCAQAARYDLDLRLDLSYLERFLIKRNRTPRDFRLDVFELEFTLATPREIAFWKSKLGKRLNWMNVRRLEKHRKPLWSTHLVGYWQSARYFASQEALIRQRFRFKPLVSSAAFDWQAKIAEQASPVMVHVRRGDYVGNPLHEVCTADYFQQAMQRMVDLQKQSHFFIFSDDIAWCQQVFPAQDRLSFVDACASEAEEMFLMTLCHHHIISNSSFSWWGAWLGSHPQKTVFAPSRWSPDEALNNQFISQEEIILKEWNRIGI